MLNKDCLIRQCYRASIRILDPCALLSQKVDGCLNQTKMKDEGEGRGGRRELGAGEAPVV